MKFTIVWNWFEISNVISNNRLYIRKIRRLNKALLGSFKSLLQNENRSFAFWIIVLPRKTAISACRFINPPAASCGPSIGWSGKLCSLVSPFVTRVTTPKNWLEWNVYPWTDFAKTPTPSTKSRDVSGTDIDAGWPKNITASIPSTKRADTTCTSVRRTG